MGIGPSTGRRLREAALWASTLCVPITQWTFPETLLGVIVHLKHQAKAGAKKPRQPTAAEPRHSTP
jgi:hypothetical protein